MKKMFAMLMALVMLLGVIPGALSEGEAPAQEPVFSTMAQTMNEEISTGYSGWGENYYAAIVNIDGRFLRVVALLDDETAQRVKELYRLEDYEAMNAQLDALAASLPATYTEDISASVMGQSELDALAGKTLGELEAEGYEVWAHGGGEDADVVFTMSCGLFNYDFVVNESYAQYLEKAETEDFSGFTVKSASFAGLSSYVLDLNYHADGTYVPSETGDTGVDSFSAWMQILAKALSSAEIGKETDQEEEFAPMPEEAAVFSGSWVCDRASMEMNWEEVGFKVLISWSSSAWEHSEWEYSCFYHEGSLVSVPFGRRTDYVFDEDGNVVSAQEIYDDGEATFILDAEGYLIWQDQKEDAGAGMRFERVDDKAEDNGIFLQ